MYLPQYVIPRCPDKKNETDIENLIPLNRLFAYPSEPFLQNGGYTILDSGAYGLYQRGSSINLNYMKKLSAHYEKYATENVFCVAPDEYLNPIASMSNFISWKNSKLFQSVCPVIQSWHEKQIDENCIMKQVKFYRKNTSQDRIFFSNNALTASEASFFGLNEIFRKIHQAGFKWIHNLGAGWSLKDIKEWKKFEQLDSMDSIAYYSTKNINEFGSLNPFENVKSICRL